MIFRSGIGPRAKTSPGSLLVLLAGWINRRQLDAIENLKEENRLLKVRLGVRGVRSTDAERGATEARRAETIDLCIRVRLISGLV